MKDIEALQGVIAAIRDLDEPTRQRIVETALIFCKGAGPVVRKGRPPGSRNRAAVPTATAQPVLPMDQPDPEFNRDYKEVREA